MTQKLWISSPSKNPEGEVSQNYRQKGSGHFDMSFPGSCKIKKRANFEIQRGTGKAVGGALTGSSYTAHFIMDCVVVVSDTQNPRGMEKVHAMGEFFNQKR